MSIFLVQFLHPQADISNASGTLQGQLVAKSYNGSLQFQHTPLAYDAGKAVNVDVDVISTKTAAQPSPSPLPAPPSGALPTAAIVGIVIAAVALLGAGIALGLGAVFRAPTEPVVTREPPALAPSYQPLAASSTQKLIT